MLDAGVGRHLTTLGEEAARFSLPRTHARRSCALNYLVPLTLPPVDARLSLPPVKGSVSLPRLRGANCKNSQCRTAKSIS